MLGLEVGGEGKAWAFGRLELWEGWLVGGCNDVRQCGVGVGSGW